MEAIKNTQWSEEHAIEFIRKLRDDLLKDFLDERYIKEYLSLHYNVKELSNIKIEFIKKEVKELLLAPVDRQHYESLLKSMEDFEGAASVEGDHHLFYAEIETVLMRYLY